ncbi:uncharacterized protein LOC117559020 isoform X2 [Gymnodraco acuticeps]|uniref:Uncharacterized protein LOC117559020 isoform X2 n=1 Tax=Gymnodraco acuticeps TaxID=8218 RepID=A0A6P8VLL6_GYMAC|nr:uncharacterized protein LOC117559020 isoform X2 [Gymnodraco acuticeps]
MESYFLFRGSQRVTLKIDDMRVDRISRIFQVNAGSLFITDAANVAVFPLDSGSFCSLDLSDHGHYEVHGEKPGETQRIQTEPAESRPFAFRHSQPMSTANMSQLTRSISTPRSFQRSIHVSEIMDRKIVSTRVVMIRFVESEASVPLITGKVNVAMGDSEEYILTDTVGNEIGLCTGSRMQERSMLLRALLSGNGVEEAQEADTMTGPMFSSCCRSSVGCRLCVEEWRITSPQCLKCRDQEPVYTQVAGLSAALDALRALP